MIDQSALRAMAYCNQKRDRTHTVECRLFLESMSKASGMQAIAMLATAIEREPEMRRSEDKLAMNKYKP